MSDSINNSLQEKINRSQAIDSAMHQCADILKCSPNDIHKRILKMRNQLDQCERIIGGVNG